LGAFQIQQSAVHSQVCSSSVAICELSEPLVGLVLPLHIAMSVQTQPLYDHANQCIYMYIVVMLNTMHDAIDDVSVQVH
jgi:hypothetical protein